MTHAGNSPGFQAGMSPSQRESLMTMHIFKSGTSSDDIETRHERALELTHLLHVKAENGESIAEAAAEGFKAILNADACEIASVIRVAWLDHPHGFAHAMIGWNLDGEIMSPGAMLAQREGAAGCENGLGGQVRGVGQSGQACSTVRVDESAMPENEHYQKSLEPLGLRWGLISMHRIEPPNEGTGIVRLWRKSDAGAFGEEDANFLQHLHSMLGPWLWERLVGQLSKLSQQPAVLGTIQRLTPAQRGVLCHLLEGGTEAEIAKRIFRSRYTVHDHVRAIYAALGVKNRLELVLKLTRADPQIRVNGAIKGQVAVGATLEHL